MALSQSALDVSVASVMAQLYCLPLLAEQLERKTLANYHFIGGDEKEYGPYSAEQMRQFMSQNRLTPQSQVSIDGGV